MGCAVSASPPTRPDLVVRRREYQPTRQVILRWRDTFAEQGDGCGPHSLASWTPTAGHDLHPAREVSAGSTDAADKGSAGGGNLSQQVPRDHQTLNLARALVNLSDLGIAIEALGWEVLGVTGATENLDRVAGTPA